MNFYHWVTFQKQPRVRHVAFGVEAVGHWETRSGKTACGHKDFLVGARGDEPKCSRCVSWVQGRSDLMEHKS